MKHRFGRRAVSLVVLLGASLCATALAPGEARTATGHEKFTIYAVATGAQFMNHADDRIRGMSANPFTPNQQALVILANGTEKKNGPFPGDDILYTFKLYRDPGLTKSLGSAFFTCYYAFAKRATCKTYYEFDDGVLLASGLIPFGSSRFTLGVGGGTKSYLGAHGEVAAVPAPHAPNKAERLDFVLLRS